MKKILLTLSLFYSMNLSAQNNFPTSGFAGIETNNNPAAPFHIRGSFNNISGGRNAIILDNQNISGNRSSDVLWLANGVAKWEMGNDIYANGKQNFYLFDLENTSAPRLFIDEFGNTGLGISDTKGYKLAVAGSVIGESVTVKLQANWPDYVFKSSYELPSLKAVKAYIDKNQHLPEIPSEHEISERGLNLGEMNKLLLKKVEELTLYLIQKENTIEDLAKRLKKLEDNSKALK